MNLDIAATDGKLNKLPLELWAVLSVARLQALWKIQYQNAAN